jgi:hypothetical protein
VSETIFTILFLPKQPADRRGPPASLRVSADHRWSMDHSLINTILENAVSWLRRLIGSLSLRSPGFELESVNVGFVIDDLQVNLFNNAFQLLRLYSVK